MNYLELLKETAKRFNSIVCLGMDPVIEDIPITTGSVKERIVAFYAEMLDAIEKRKVYPAAVKPNYAFYAQYGLEGIEALVSVCERSRAVGLPVILDVKRGDIGKTAEAYARESFEFFKADAVTLSPFLGYDSIEPFMKRFPGKGYYVLNKTSNKSSAELQDVRVGEDTVYALVSKKIIDWYQPGIGAVVGATYPSQLSEILGIYAHAGKEVPLLIPGVGSQGGDVAEVISALKKSPSVRIHRINSSSAINFAYKKHPGMHFAEAAVNELERLNAEINGLL
ncbi:MAG TPA: orotidine-5'-phosphate decarboxylase [Spirochaetota bacterium]|nr:orotidine-5'-phosphate decarboxylase [Spirochaetota bacterium]